ncbi:MAG: ribose-phosphate diphosphokinase, partial [Acidimicrobiia bacterium]
MELRSQKRLMVFSGSANEPLAEEVAHILGVELGGVERSVFANGEIYIHYTESVRGADAFVIQSHTQPLNFNIMEQLIMIDALKRASAKRITAVVPFYGYARQDKKGRPREPISARLMGDLFVVAGADRIVSLDLHTGQIQGFVDKPFDHLTGLHLFSTYLR